MSAFIAGKVAEGDARGNVGRLLAAMKKHQALHDGVLSAYPYGELRVSYDAKSNNYRVSEVYESNNPGYASVMRDRNTGELRSIQDHLLDYLGKLDRRYDTRNREDDAWKQANLIDLITLEDTQTTDQKIAEAKQKLIQK